MSYVLEPGEGILQQQNGVSVSGELQIEYAKALLTSKYIVFLEESDDEDEDEVEVARLPLNSIRVFQNVPQVFITGDSLDPEMTVYFLDMTLTISFDIFRSSKRREAYQKWIDSITEMFRSGVINAAIPTINSYTPQTPPIQSPVGHVVANIQPSKNFCGNCGQRIDGSANFCKYCGAKV